MDLGLKVLNAIVTHPKIKPSIQWRMEDILQERNPTNPMG